MSTRSLRYIIRETAVWNWDDERVDPASPPVLIVTATTDELSSSGRVAGQLQVSIANGDVNDFPAGKVITIGVE